MKFKVGDVVICVKEDHTPQFIGSCWVVVDILGLLYMCTNHHLYPNDSYPFKEIEIVEATPLIMELI